MPIFEDASGNLHYGQQVSRRAERNARMSRFRKTPGMIKLCLEWIANGGDFDLWCRTRDLPTSKVREVLLTKQWEQDYAFAKRLRAHAIADKAERMLDDVAQGRVDPKSAETFMKNARWFASVYNADDYGEKRSVSHQHTLTLQDEHREALRQLKDVRRQEWEDLARVQEREAVSRPALAGNVYDHGISVPSEDDKD